MTKKVSRLYTGFIPEHYELFLDPNRTTLKARGTVTITGLKKGRPSQRLTFHQHEVKVLSATITKLDKKGDQDIIVARINHHATLDEVRLHSDALLHAGKYRVTMEFEAVISNGLSGIYFSDYEANGSEHRMLSTQLESHFARRAFPCIDEPEAKATFTLSITSNEGEEVLGNTPIAAQQTKDGVTTTTFETTPKMSTYLLAFVIGDLQKREGASRSGVPARIWSTKAHRLESLDFALDAAEKSIDIFEEYYHTPYPIAKCDNVAIPDFSAGGMENWGLLTYREMALLADPETSTQTGRERVAEVVTHEVSHQWFGDLVTFKWWDEVWLNESFANLMAYVAMDKMYPEWHIWDTYLIDEGLQALRRDCIAGVQSVHTPVNHPDEISSVFDPSIVYAKGGRLLNMLIKYVGEDDFRNGLKVYFAKHAYSNTNGSDLWAAITEASGKDVTDFMTPWLKQSGFPVITVTQKGKNLTIRQDHFLLDKSKVDTNRLWPVLLLADNTEVPELLETREVHIALPSDEYVHLNTDAVGHYIVNYTEPAHSEALAVRAANKTLTVGERIMLLNDSSMVARAGLGTYSETLELLKYYADEDNEVVWGIMGMVLGEVRRFIDHDASLEEPMKASLRVLIQKQYDRLGWEPKKDEPPQDTKLRADILGTGVFAEHPDITTKAFDLFEAYKKDPSAVATDIRGVIFGTAVRNYHPGAFDYLLGLDQTTTDPSLKADILGSLTSTRREDEATILLARLKDGKKVRQQDVDHWLVYLLRNRYARSASWDWMRNEWPWLEATFSKDPSYDYLPRYAASAFSTRTLLNEYKTFFGAKTDQIVLAANIRLGIEELEARVAWLERDLASVQNFYKK